MTLEQIAAAIVLLAAFALPTLVLLTVRSRRAARRRRRQIRQALLSDALADYRAHRRAGCHEIHALHRLTAAGYDAETVGQVIETIAREEAR